MRFLITFATYYFDLMIKPILIIAALYLFLLPCGAQEAWQYYERGEAGKLHPIDNIHYKAEVQGSFSSDKTPLWLNANKYGLSSLEKNNGYLRGALYRPLRTDSARRWGLGYGVDMAVATHYTSRVVLQQAYVEVRWFHGLLTVGEKEYPMELKNNRLSSGSQTLGINARPIPQVRLALPDYWTIPALGRWFHLKGHVAFGAFTDGDWQQDFTNSQRYDRDVLYHSKAGYIMIGKPEAFYPVTLELGLEMAAQFGGKQYTMQDGAIQKRTLGGHGIKDFFDALVPGGSEATDGEYENVAGNELGSWVARLNYDNDAWGLSIYADHYFEDHSQMLFLSQNGYGTGEDYMKKVKNRFFLYSLKDIMLGGELRLKNGSWIKNIVMEYLYTKYQSGPVFHNHTAIIPDHIGGIDNYYNHSNYLGWQHWGQVMGNPLYRSPIYNNDGVINVDDNRFVAWHIGIDGQPTERLGYRILGSWQRGFGTYAKPYTHARHNASFMVEANYHFPHQWTVTGAWGMDFGSILGHNRGLQVTITKEGILKR